MSFVEVDDVISVTERMVAEVCKEAVGLEVRLPLPRMTWDEAMNRYGSDKPDTRFGMELTDVSEIVRSCGFGVFTGALEAGGSVRGINVKGQAEMPRKKIDALVEFAKGYGAKGLAYLSVMPDGSYKSSFAKFMSQEELENLVKAMGGEPGDLLLFAADRLKIVWAVLGALRCEVARQLELVDRDRFDFLWVSGFPRCHASSLYHAHGGGSGETGIRSRQCAGQGVRHRIERRGAGRRQCAYFPERRAGADVPGAGLYR